MGETRHGSNLQDFALLASWPTTRETDGAKNVRTPEGSAREMARKGGPQDLNQAATLASWATPTSRDHKDGDYTPNVAENALLGRQVWQAGWPTPTSLSPATANYNEAGDSCNLRKMRLLGDDQAKSVAIAQAALEPTLFAELHGTHLDASDNAIRAHLLTKKGFAEDGARKAAKAFRDTVALVLGDPSGYTPTTAEEKPQATSGMESGQNIGSGGRTAEGSGVLSLKVPYGAGALNVEIRVTGERLKPSHIAKVRRYLELAEADLTEGGSEE